MSKLLLAAAVAVPLVLSACVVQTAGRHRRQELPVPIMPSVVTLGDTQYFSYGEYTYYYDYDHDAWYYSNQGREPWIAIPRYRYPERYRYKGTWHYRDRERDLHDRDHDRD